MKIKGLLLFFVFWASFCQAQEGEGQGLFSASIVAGVNLSQIDGDAAAGYNKIGANVGGRAAIQFAKRFHISMELLFSQKGSFSRKQGFHYRLDYIEIPIEFNINEWFVTDHKDRTYSRIVFGAGFSYNQLLFGNKKESGFVTPSFEEDYRKQNVMFMFTGTVFFTRNWGLNVRYARSLYSIRKRVESPKGSGQYIRGPVEISHHITFRLVFQF